MSLIEQASLVITPNAVKASKLYAIKPIDGTGDLSVVRATTATRVNELGLIEQVPANVARLDYTNGSCPSILVEPQRTNLALNSQSFIPSWSTSPQTNGTITSTTTIDPEGFTNAVRITNVSGGGTLGRLFTVVSGTTYTSSIWVRRVTGTGIVELVDLNGGSISLNLTNEWQRFSVTSTAVSIGRFYIRATIIGNSIEVWGAQLEVRANATSYIPTVASAVTRNADVISKSGISSLIGQTEGTIYADIDFNNAQSKTETNRIIELTDGTNSNRIIVAFGSTNTLLTRLTASGVEQASFAATSISVGMLKIALSYSSSGVKLYVNGTLRQSNLSASIPATNRMNLGYEGTTNLQQLNDGINSVVLWKTKLTDQQCINLTNI